MSKRSSAPSQPPPTAPTPVPTSPPVELFHPGVTLDSKSECNEVLDHEGETIPLPSNPELPAIPDEVIAPPVHTPSPDPRPDCPDLLELVPDCLCATNTSIGSGGSSSLLNWMTQIRWRRVMMSWQCLHLSLISHSHLQRLSLALMLRSEDRLYLSESVPPMNSGKSGRKWRCIC